MTHILRNEILKNRLLLQINCELEILFFFQIAVTNISFFFGQQGDISHMMHFMLVLFDILFNPDKIKRYLSSTYELIKA